MDDFETFKASREKIDPTARKFSKRQWQKAYAAYRSSRERVKNEARSTQSDKGHSSQRRKSASRGSSAYGYSALSPAANLRSEVRQNSAYGDLRMLVDLLAWILIGLTVLTAVMRLVYYTNASAALVAMLEAATLVIAVVALRLLAHVIIDIPDIALRRELSGETQTPQQRDTNE